MLAIHAGHLTETLLGMKEQKRFGHGQMPRKERWRCSACTTRLAALCVHFLSFARQDRQKGPRPCPLCQHSWDAKDNRVVRRGRTRNAWWRSVAENVIWSCTECVTALEAQESLRSS